MSFKKNKYQVIKGAISTELADFCYQYFLNKRAVARHLFDEKYVSQFTEYFGVWNDTQIPDTYSHYADIVMETLLQKVKPVMEKESGLKLTETYSYARIYKKGDELKRHKDRFSCEISTTMNLGGDPWAIYLEPSGKEGLKGIKVDLKPGDMLVYSGCELEHWRKKFKGENTIVNIEHKDPVFLIESLQGSKVIVKDTIDSSTVYFKTSTGGQINAHIKVKKVRSTSSSGGIIQLTGRTNSHEAKESSGGIIKASKVISIQTKANTSFGGVCSAFGTEVFEATASFGGVVNVYGSPSSLTQSSSFGGDIIEKQINE